VLILAIDTSTRRVGAALGSQQGVVAAIELGGATSDGPPRHAEQLVPAIEHLVRTTGLPLRQLSAIAVAVGPGMFTGLRVGVTTAKVMAQALRIPVIPIPSLDLVAYPLRHASGKVVIPLLDARRNELYYARYRPVPGGLQRESEYELATPQDLLGAIDAAGDSVVVAGDGALRFREPFELNDRCEIAGPQLRRPEPGRAGRARVGPVRARGFRVARRRGYRCTSGAATPRSRTTGGRRSGTTASAPRRARSARRRHAPAAPARRAADRGPGRAAPWTSSLFLSELALRSSRAYFVARVGRDVVGYGGLMMTLDDGHITTLAVDPRWHRHKIGTRLLLALAREAITRGATGLTLEVRLSNLGAQALYRRFGFEPVGVRKGYYVETKEDALIMWAHEVDQPEYLRVLDAAERKIPGCDRGGAARDLGEDGG